MKLAVEEDKEEEEEEDGGHHTLAGETEAQRVLRRHVFMHDAVRLDFCCTMCCCFEPDVGGVVLLLLWRSLVRRCGITCCGITCYAAAASVHTQSTSPGVACIATRMPADPYVAGGGRLRVHAGGGGWGGAHHLRPGQVVRLSNRRDGLVGWAGLGWWFGLEV